MITHKSYVQSLYNNYSAEYVSKKILDSPQKFWQSHVWKTWLFLFTV